MDHQKDERAAPGKSKGLKGLEGVRVVAKNFVEPFEEKSLKGAGGEKTFRAVDIPGRSPRVEDGFYERGPGSLTGGINDIQIITESEGKILKEEEGETKTKKENDEQ